ITAGERSVACGQRNVQVPPARMGRTKTTEAFCPFGQVPRCRNAAGNATLACGYDNFVLSGHFNS
ncbi:MAG: hypothetical protein LBG92_09785, partial [Prevotellaceae bacterium]|nr:hypothetical protein [Prevotellaceae bacterium]